MQLMQKKSLSLPGTKIFCQPQMVEKHGNRNKSESFSIRKKFAGFKKRIPAWQQEISENELEPVLQLWTTTDGGATWNERNAALLIDPADFLFFTPEIGIAIVQTSDGSNNDNIYRTTDGGVTWNAVKIPLNLDISSISSTDAKTGFLVADSPVNNDDNYISKMVLLKTSNAGATWASIDLPISASSNERERTRFVRFMDNKYSWVIKSNPHSETSRSDLLRKLIVEGKHQKNVVG